MYRSILSLIGILVLVSLIAQYSAIFQHETTEIVLTLSKKEFFGGVTSTTTAASDGRDPLLQPNDTMARQSHALMLGTEPDPPHGSNTTMTRPVYYTVFSTSCSDQQHWESMVFFFHAHKVRQPGHVTRIASGCSSTEAVELQQIHDQYIAPLSPEGKFHLHLTPDYSRLRKTEGKYPYKYMNKPYGLRHWMENSLGIKEGVPIAPELADGIVILMDPDMVLLRPLVHDFTNEEVMWVGEPLSKVVRHGFPIAQQDGYLDSEWVDFNWTYIVDAPAGSFVTPPRFEEGPLRWNTGPPYLLTIKDAYGVTVQWTELAPRVLDVYPHLFAEMYGFIIATVQLKLPFTLIRSIVVSTTETNAREGWPYIDALPDDEVCRSTYLRPELPIGLHYCQRYMLGKYFFNKYRLKKTIMDCAKNLLERIPPEVVGKYDYAITPPRADFTDPGIEPIQLSTMRAKREAFMLCRLTDAVNEALRDHKTRKCESPNLNETYSIHDDPSSY